MKPRELELAPSTVLREVNTHLDTTTTPHFTAPLGIRRHLPLFVFLPGLDGTGMYISSQLEGLKPHYDVRCLCIPVADRQGYDALAKVAADNIAHERRERGAGVYGCPGGAPVTVAGESFGGPIALRLAALHPDAVQVLVVINSGSALRRHPLLFYGSYLIPVVPGSLYDASAYCITPFLSDLRRLERENQALMMPPMSVRIVPKDTVHHRVRLMADFEMKDDEIAGITADTLCIASVRDRLLPSLAESRRLASLIPGSQLHLVNDASHTVLLEAGVSLADILKERNLLPPEEGYPLDRMAPVPAISALISREQAKMAAHASTQANEMSEQGKAVADNALTAAAAARADPSNLDAFDEASARVKALVDQVRASAAAEAERTANRPESPTPSAFGSLVATQDQSREEEARLLKEAEAEKEAERRAKRAAKMAKFKGNTVEELTGAAAGAAIDRMMEEIPQMRFWNWVTRPEFVGIENIPLDDRPLLFVGNHTLYGLFDMPLMIYEIRKKTGLTLRGLAHPLHYMSAFGDLLARYGAVKATPRNCFKMLQAGQAVLLYPGGAREVAKRKGEKYKLMWKDDAEFVRLAMRFQCTIVPFASVGTEDAFNIAMDSEEIMRSPAGPHIRRMLDNAGMGPDSEYPVDPVDVIPPVSTGMAGVPFVPAPKRLYFKFCEPITTDHFAKADLDDKEKCQALYDQVRAAVEGSIEELQAMREEDPLQKVIPRTILSTLEFWDGT